MKKGICGTSGNRKILWGIVFLAVICIAAAGLKNLKKEALLMLALLLFPFLFYKSASADMGPKASVQIDIEGLEGEKYYMTLLSKKDSSGPWGTTWSSQSEEAGYYALKNYQDTDQYYFLGYFQECTETNQFNWSYHPPENFKILIYLPEYQKYIVSSKAYTQYAFHSSYFMKIGNKNEILEFNRDYDFRIDFIGFVFRLFSTLIIEILLAIPFGYLQKKSVKVIAFTNLITQIILNISLGVCVYSIGEWAYILCYLPMELGIFVIEGIAYSILFPAHVKEKQTHFYLKVWCYALLANVLSFFAGYTYLTLSTIINNGI